MTKIPIGYDVSGKPVYMDYGRSLKSPLISVSKHILRPFMPPKLGSIIIIPDIKIDERLNLLEAWMQRIETKGKTGHEFVNDFHSEVFKSVRRKISDSQSFNDIYDHVTEQCTRFAHFAHDKNQLVRNGVRWGYHIYKQVRDKMWSINRKFKG